MFGGLAGGTMWPADDFVPEVDAAQCLLLNAPPRCPHCGGPALAPVS